MSIVEEFKGKYEDAQGKIKELEEELAMARATLTTMEKAKKKIEEKKDNLQGELQKKNTELESANM